MDRARQQRGQLVQLEEERLAAKREAYLRRVNPTRPLSSAEEELTARYRRRKVWLHVVTFAAISNRWHQQLVQTKHLVWMAKVNGKAASTIQRIWRKWKWRHASKHTVVVYTWLRKCLWKLLLKVRCRRKARHAAPTVHADPPDGEPRHAELQPDDGSLAQQSHPRTAGWHVRIPRRSFDEVQLRANTAALHLSGPTSTATALECRLCQVGGTASTTIDSARIAN
jgi:hypothetical protein